MRGFCFVNAAWKGFARLVLPRCAPERGKCHRADTSSRWSLHGRSLPLLLYGQWIVSHVTFFFRVSALDVTFMAAGVTPYGVLATIAGCRPSQ